MSLPKPTNSADASPFYMGPWLIQPMLNRIQSPDEVHTLEPRLMRLLVFLAEHAGDVIARETLLEAVWGDTIVTENSLTNSISGLRKLLNDDPHQPRYIETIRGSGYRLIAPITFPKESTSTPPPKQPNAAPAPQDMPLQSDARTSKKRTLWTVVSIVAGVLMAAILSVVLHDPPPQPPRITPLTSLPGIEIDPMLSPDGKLLAFAWYDGQGDPADLYVQDLTTDTRVRLTSRLGHERYPTWSPDGRQVAFLARYPTDDGIACTLYTIPSLGGTPRKLIDTPCTPNGLSWSPNGSLLAYAAPDSTTGTRRIFLLDLDSLAVKPLTSPTSPREQDFNPVFSPDGRMIAFRRGPMAAASNLYLVPTDAISPSKAHPVTEHIGALYGFDWTPDGKALILAATQNGKNGLWRIPATGGMPELLHFYLHDLGYLTVARQGNHLVYMASNAKLDIWRYPGPAASSDARSEPLIESTRGDGYPRYSPDGQRIAFTSNRSGEGEIWLSDAEGNNLLRLTNLNQQVTHRPAWSPDGQKLAFHSSRDQLFDLYVIDVAGGPPHRLTTMASGNSYPSWSPDGRFIYFSSGRSGRDEIWKIPADGGTPTQVTQHGGLWAQSTPDGATLYFSRPDTTGLWTLSLNDGTERRVVDADPQNWFLHDKGLYFVRQRQLAFDLFRLDTATGRIDSLAALPNPIGAYYERFGLSVSPDEQWILYAQVLETESDLFLMEYF